MCRLAGWNRRGGKFRRICGRSDYVFTLLPSQDRPTANSTRNSFTTMAHQSPEHFLASCAP